MKKGILAAIGISLLLLMVSCSMGEKDPDNGLYKREFLGEWIRMDTGERWYITGDTIKVNGLLSYKEPKLTRVSQEVVKVSESGSTDYYLFASRTANASFSAQVVFIGGNGGSASSYSAARDIWGDNGQRPVVVGVTNDNQPGLAPVTVTPDPDTGKIVVPNHIPGDPVVIVPIGSEWGNVKVGLTPWADQDMGLIPLAHGVNLKASIRLADSTLDISELYADGSTLEYIIEIENIGTDNCVGASYEISWNAADFTQSAGNKTGVLNTIVPGSKIQISLSLTSHPIAQESQNKEIKVSILSLDTVNKVPTYWNDTVSVHFYKEWVPFSFRSQRPVQGVIRTPHNKTFYFKTASSSNGYTYSINLPWSKDNYIITFLGAAIGTETMYSLAIDGTPPSDWNSLKGEELFKYEGTNKSADTAPLIDLADNNTFMYYLYTDAIQYYRVNLGDTPPGKAGNYIAVYFEANGGQFYVSSNPQLITSGRTVSAPQNPNRSGYFFGGWYTDPELTTLFDFYQPLYASITLYAKWNRPAVVTFNTNGGNTIDFQIVGVSTQVSAPADPTRTGYFFDGWYSDSELTIPYDFSEPVPGDITLYAKWLEIDATRNL